MANGTVWTFTQQGPPSKTFTLEGWAAPFGRARMSPVVTEERKERNQKIRYPGNEGPPTRLMFGVDWEDIVLKGRWMDKDLGFDNAGRKAAYIQEFIGDKVPVVISWGDIVQYQGMILGLKIAREDAANIAWEMHIGLDYAYGHDTQVTPQTPPTVSPIARTLAQIFLKGAIDPSTLNLTVKNWQPSFLDSISDVIGKINSAFASFINIANQIDEIENATAGEVQSLLSGIHSLKTSLLILKNTFSTAAVDLVLISRSATADVNWFNFKSTQEDRSATILAALADMTSFLNVGQQGSVRKSYTAQPGDTWESISNKFYGGPDSASKIRIANGIKFGEKPVAGRIYTIPQTT